MSGSDEKWLDVIWETKRHVIAKSFRDARDKIPWVFSDIEIGDVFWVKDGPKTKRYVAEDCDGSIRLVERYA
jgi:hypothetical protein